MYLFQTHFQANTPVYNALSKATGVGHKTITQLCDRLGVSKHVKLQNLSSSQLTLLNQIVYKNCLTDSEYRTFIQKNVNNLHSMSSYRGFRHYDGLPCRGQRTRTNAQTSKRQERKTNKIGKTSR